MDAKTFPSLISADVRPEHFLNVSGASFARLTSKLSSRMADVICTEDALRPIKGYQASGLLKTTELLRRIPQIHRRYHRQLKETVTKAVEKPRSLSTALRRHTERRSTDPDSRISQLTSIKTPVNLTNLKSSAAVTPSFIKSSRHLPTGNQSPEKAELPQLKKSQTTDIELPDLRSRMKQYFESVRASIGKSSVLDLSSHRSNSVKKPFKRGRKAVYKRACL